MGWDLVILPVSCCFEYTPPQSPIPRMNCEHEDKMTASLRRSPAAGPLDDDDLLAEILLRLPPQPSSLPRASAVCSRWRSLVADPGFSRRFRIHHSRRNPPPLLGCFSGGNGLSFEPALATPNRVPPERFSLQIDDGEWLYSHGCRHGLVLVFDLNRNQFLVWDPVTGDRHSLVVPPGFEGQDIHGAVLRAAGEVDHFQVVLVMTEIDDEAQHTQAVARVYSSQTGLWSNLISTPLPPEAYQRWLPTTVCPQPAVLVGDALYWMLSGKLFEGILEFNLDTQRLAVIHVPVNMFKEYSCFTVIRAEGGGMGFLVVFSFAAQAQLWKQLWTDCDGVVSWGLERTIQLDKLLSPNSERWIRILGYAEDNNRVFMGTPMGLFTVQLQSLKFKKLSETYTLGLCHPFESVYAAEKGIGGRHEGAEIPHNT